MEKRKQSKLEECAEKSVDLHYAADGEAPTAILPTQMLDATSGDL